MQTFITSTTNPFETTARQLDRLRLNKQALEGWQILMNLLDLGPDNQFRKSRGWSNHPAVRQWAGYELALYEYVMAMVAEWKRRGYNSTIGDKATATITTAHALGLLSQPAYPQWLASGELVSSHHLALLNKDYEWYSQFQWAEDKGSRPDSYEYVWGLQA